MICYILIGVVVAQQIVHAIERRDLYNRLMCRDLTDYKRNTGGEADKETRSTAHEKAIDKWRKGK
jgi:hypothetical protein